MTRVAFVTEDETDVQSIGAFARRILGPIESQRYLVRTGFANVLKAAPVLIKEAARAKNDAVIVAVDCDGTEDHFSESHRADKCRLCRVHRELPEAHKLDQVAGTRFHVVATMPVRTIETWLAVAGDKVVAGSIHELGRRPEERRRLKHIVYGHSTPSRSRMEQVVQEVVPTCDMARLERTCPSFADFTRLLQPLRRST